MSATRCCAAHHFIFPFERETNVNSSTEKNTCQVCPRSQGRPNDLEPIYLSTKHLVLAPEYLGTATRPPRWDDLKMTEAFRWRFDLFSSCLTLNME